MTVPGSPIKPTEAGEQGSLDCICGVHACSMDPITCPRGEDSFHCAAEWRLAEVYRLHTQEYYPSGVPTGFCVTCGTEWPCQTARLADPNA